MTAVIRALAIKPRFRAPPSGVSLSEEDAAIAKGMLHRGDRQHDIAAWFGVNAGRIAEIATGASFTRVKARKENLPPPGPYLSGRSAHEVKLALENAERAIALAKAFLPN